MDYYLHHMGTSVTTPVPSRYSTLWSHNKHTDQLQSIFKEAADDFRPHRGKINHVFLDDSTFLSTFVLDGIDSAEIDSTIRQSKDGSNFVNIPAKYTTKVLKKVDQQTASSTVQQWKTNISRLLGSDCGTAEVVRESPSCVQRGYSLWNGIVSVILVSSGKNGVFNVWLPIQRDNTSRSANGNKQSSAPRYFFTTTIELASAYDLAAVTYTGEPFFQYPAAKFPVAVTGRAPAT